MRMIQYMLQLLQPNSLRVFYCFCAPCFRSGEGFILVKSFIWFCCQIRGSPKNREKTGAFNESHFFEFLLSWSFSSATIAAWQTKHSPCSPYHFRSTQTITGKWNSNPYSWFCLQMPPFPVYMYVAVAWTRPFMRPPHILNHGHV